jgi:sigma-B regulation protein RsbU (phosphoserine phosphatase)
MKRILLKLYNNDLVPRIHDQLEEAGYKVEIFNKNEINVLNYDLLVVDQEIVENLDDTKSYLNNKEIPVIVAFDKELMNTDIVETFKKGVVDISYIKITNIKPLIDSINRFFEKEASLIVDIDEVEEWQLIKVQSELNIKNSYKLKLIIDKMIDEDKNSLLIDLSKLNYMESVGLGVLIYIKKRLAEIKGECKFIIPSLRIKKLINMVNLDKYFEIYDKLSEIVTLENKSEKIKIAIIDDARFMRTLISSVLEEEGFDTIAYGNPVEALKELTEQPTDIILVDYEMPEMNGLEFIDKFRPKEKHVPTVMLTTETDVNLAVSAIRLGASDFLTKPFKKDELIHILRKVDRENKLIKENKRLFEQLQIREKELKKKNDQLYKLYSELEDELKMASEIQRNLLPETYPLIPGYKFSVKYKPSQDIGGDFYDFIELPNGDVGIAFADVSGHGIPASLLSTMFKVHLVTYTKEIEEPSELLKKLNEEVVETFPEGKFISLFYLTINKETGMINYCKAAQEPALLVKQSGEIIELEGKGQVLGLFSEKDFPGILKFKTESIKLESGDKLFLYTDGINESQNKHDEFYGVDRLKDALKESSSDSAEDTLVNVYNDLKLFLDGLSILDDLTLMCIEKE